MSRKICMADKCKCKIDNEGDAFCKKHDKTHFICSNCGIPLNLKNIGKSKECKEFYICLYCEKEGKNE